MAKTEKKYHRSVSVRQNDNGYTVEFSKWLTKSGDYSGCCGPYGSEERESWTKVATTPEAAKKLVNEAMGL